MIMPANESELMLGFFIGLGLVVLAQVVSFVLGIIVGGFKIGSLERTVEVEVGSQLSGQIAELLADFNDEVSQGQPIALLDSRTFAARVREARAELEEAQARIEIREAAIAEAVIARDLAPSNEAVALEELLIYLQAQRR